MFSSGGSGNSLFAMALGITGLRSKYTSLYYTYSANMIVIGLVVFVVSFLLST